MFQKDNQLTDEQHVDGYHRVEPQSAGAKAKEVKNALFSAAAGFLSAKNAVIGLLIGTVVYSSQTQITNIKTEYEQRLMVLEQQIVTSGEQVTSLLEAKHQGFFVSKNDKKISNTVNNLDKRLTKSVDAELNKVDKALMAKISRKGDDVSQELEALIKTKVIKLDRELTAKIEAAGSDLTDKLKARMTRDELDSSKFRLHSANTQKDMENKVSDAKSELKSAGVSFNKRITKNEKTSKAGFASMNDNFGKIQGSFKTERDALQAADKTIGARIHLNAATTEANMKDVNSQFDDVETSMKAENVKLEHQELNLRRRISHNENNFRTVDGQFGNLTASFKSERSTLEAADAQIGERIDSNEEDFKQFGSQFQQLFSSFKEDQGISVNKWKEFARLQGAFKQYQLDAKDFVSTVQEGEKNRLDGVDERLTQEIFRMQQGFYASLIRIQGQVNQATGMDSSFGGNPYSAPSYSGSTSGGSSTSGSTTTGSTSGSTTGSTSGTSGTGSTSDKGGVAGSDSSSTSVNADGSSKVNADGSSKVNADGSSKVNADGSSKVNADGSSKVNADGSSKVNADGSSKVNDGTTSGHAGSTSGQAGSSTSGQAGSTSGQAGSTSGTAGSSTSGQAGSTSGTAGSSTSSTSGQTSGQSSSATGNSLLDDMMKGMQDQLKVQLDQQRKELEKKISSVQSAVDGKFMLCAGDKEECKCMAGNTVRAVYLDQYGYFDSINKVFKTNSIQCQQEQFGIENDTELQFSCYCQLNTARNI